MRHLTYVLIMLFCVPLASCVEQTLQQKMDGITSNFSPLNSTSKEMHGVVIRIKGCSISAERVATCHMSAMSKYQDRTLNLTAGTYNKLQDDTGVSYNTLMAFGQDASNRQQRSALLVADTVYDFKVVAQNISSRATKIRSLNITRMDVTGPTGKGNYGKIEMVFSHPPMIGATDNTISSQTDTAQPQIQSSEHATQQKQTSPAGYMPYRYLFAKIVPVTDDMPRNELQAKGVYLHLREDGSLGHNFSKPGPYGYVPKQGWKVEPGKLVIIFDQISYTFDTREGTSSMMTYLDQGGLYKMSVWVKGKGER